MNTSNSVGFVTLGTVMAVLPTLFPQAFPGTGFDGTSTRALWLNVVGTVQILLGVSFLLQLWANRIIDRVTTFSLSTLDRSPLPTPELQAQQRVA